MGNSAVEPIPGAESRGKSFLERLAGVFLSPEETFTDVARRPDFLAPLVLMTLCSAALIETLMARIGMARVLRIALEQRGTSLPPEQFQRALAIQTVIVHISGVVVVPVMMLILAAIGLLIVNLIFGAQVSFKKALSVASYANLIYLIYDVMGGAMIFLGDPEHFNINNFVPSNPGFFLNPLETSKVVLTLASSLDIFSFWMMALLGIGFSAATGRKVGAGRIFLIFLGFWLVWTLVRVGLAAAF